ncbi:MAG: hypothetical protein L6V91_01900 [Bacilli bacterium]|nr:MAG: hypothetical protein L6V91_01900 [Bacilli bacterium]
MNEERKDEVQELYDKCNKISNYSDLLFLVNIAISFILIFNFKYRDIFVVTSLLLNIGYVILVNVNEIYFNNLAEK